MRKAVKFVVIPIAIVALLAFAGMQIAARLVVSRIQDVLGEKGHAASIDVGWSRIVLQNVEVGAPDDWPTRQTLRAARVTLLPDWRALLSDRVSIRRIDVQDYYVSVLRSGDGRIRVFPTLRAGARARAEESDRNAGGEPQRKRDVEIGKLVFQKGHLDFFDATIAKPPYKIPFDDVHAEIGPLHAPSNDVHTSVEVQGRMVGKRRSGTVKVGGWAAMPSRDADVRTTLGGADVALLAPYLEEHASALLSAGQLDLDMTTKVQDEQLNAHGTAKLHGLDFSHGKLSSLPRRAVLAALEDRHGNVTFDFTLKGNLKDPKFSLADDLSTRIVGGFAKAIGVSVEGLAEGVGSAVKGLGGALDNLIEK